jgi:catechol 2,3-dioxygenase-like lactoylglutathione lyase family enzyme
MTGRVQLALNVNDIDEAVGFYARLLGSSPAKRRPGYANFAVDDPPLKLVLVERPGHGGSLNHLGIEVPDTAAVDAAHTRLAQAGLAATEERETTCCYARQDKFWVQGAPDGESWEVYTVTGDSQTFFGEDAGAATCCGDAGAACCGDASEHAEGKERVGCRVTDLREPRTVN